MASDWDYPKPIREATDEEIGGLIREMRRAMLIAITRGDVSAEGDTSRSTIHDHDPAQGSGSGGSVHRIRVEETRGRGEDDPMRLA